MFRSYNAFAQKNYKIIIWLIYPLLAIFCCILVQNGCFGLLTKEGYHYMVASTLLYNGIIFIECMGDYWLFSGIQSKNASHMSLLKTSSKGKMFFRDALLSDMIRRAWTIVICNTINALMGIVVFKNNFGGVGEILVNVVYALSCYSVSTLSVFLTRYGDTWYINMAAGYLSNFFFVLMIMLIQNIKIPIWIWVIIYLPISIFITVMTIEVAMKKVEDSYYDQRT